MTWIRVDTHQQRENAMLAFRERLGVNFAQAVGHRVLLESWVAENCWNGDLSKVLNEQLEAGALWRGDQDILALAYRDCFCDAAGRIREWFDRQGKLIAWKEANRRRKAASRSPDDREPDESPGPSRAHDGGQAGGQSRGPSRAPSRAPSRGMSP